MSNCPACGEPGDYCRGHGEIGDPLGFAVLGAHDEDVHDFCRPEGCEDADAFRGLIPSEEPTVITLEAIEEALLRKEPQ